ncbi:MAG: hypothetical protein HQ402_00625 [Parcubacteria group bacterium]|nr:hypothetical protein [Parcubacteria group bacterium]
MQKKKVTKVIDGDTFRVKGGQFIRIANIDTPEKGRKGSASATHALEDLIEGKTVTLNPVGKSYGRIVADKIKVGSVSVEQKMRRFNKKKG